MDSAAVFDYYPAMAVRVIAGSRSWIEGEAIRQLEKTAELPGIVDAIGMPGLHPGQGCPVDAIFLSKGRIYPHLIGTDTGCGMGLWWTTIKPIKPERIARRLKANLEHGIDSPEDHLDGVEPCGCEHSLGTVGRGNHFAELQAIDEVRDAEAVERYLGKRNSFLLVHSGSRNYGEQILFEHTAQFQGKGLATNTPEAKEYLRKHDHAVAWAHINRRVIAHRIFDALGADGGEIVDLVHNFLHRQDGGTDSEPTWIHRKGAIPTDRSEIAVIPGSRGAHSYVVQPTGDQSMSAWSVSHGAGRKMSRKDARVKFNAQQDSIAKLERTKFGSVVICEDRVLLMEEAPEAYKPIDRVVQDLVDHGLVKVIALMRPVVTYKMRRSGGDDNE